MQIFIEAINLNIWEAIEIGPYIPTMVVGNATIEKPREQWDEEERRRCGSNVFQGYFDDAKELRIKKNPKIQESSFKNQDSRIKFQESRFKNNQDQDSRIKRRFNQDKY